MLLGKVCRLFIIATLPAHGDCRIKIKLEVTRGLDKRFQLVDILELGIAVEEEGGMIGRRLSVLMELLQVLDEVVDALCVKELALLACPAHHSKSTHFANDLGWLSCVDCSNILDHSTIIVGFLVKVIAETAIDEALLLSIKPRLLRQLDGQWEHVPLVQHFQPLLQALFVVSVDLRRSELSFDSYRNAIPCHLV